MNAFKKLISISIFVIMAVVTLSLQAEAKKFDRSYLSPGKAAKAQRSSSFTGGNPDRPIITGLKNARKSLSVFVAAGDVNGDSHGANKKKNSRKSFILPYIEQDNLYK